MKAKEVIIVSIMWLSMIAGLVYSCGHEVREVEPIIITDEMVMWDSDHFVVMPQEPDTLTFVILGSVDDNTIEIYCIEDSTTQTMIVESAYTHQYYEGVKFTMIKGQ